jgi:O-methyltransferase
MVHEFFTTGRHMKNVVIWGAGQGGRMISNLLHGDIRVLAYCDSDERKWGGDVDGVPVVAPEAVPGMAPDAVFISMLNKDACAEVRARLEGMGVAARIVTAPELRRTFDLRLAALKMIAGEVRERNIPGALAELGVYRGEFAAEMNRLFPDRTLYLFDTFTGFDPRDVAVEDEGKYSRAAVGNFADTSVEAVRERLPFPDRAVFRVGYFPETAEGLDETYAVVSLDADLYKPLYDGLGHFYPRMAPGGYIIIHDYNNSRFSGARQAVRRFCEENRVFVVPLSDLHGTGIIVKP